MFGVQIDSENVENDIQTEVNSIVSEIFDKVFYNEGKTNKQIKYNFIESSEDLLARTPRSSQTLYNTHTQESKESKTQKQITQVLC